ncbi:MAG: CaiB/BaiF CoA-transferase family protein [Thermoanaerobaculia bacterium]
MSASPLSGLLVVDLSRHLPGPLAARILRDLGARVIKVEEPELGDPVRNAPPVRGGTSALASQLLAGLESIALDLKKEPARRVLERLLERADVLLETFRPGALARLGLSPEELLERYPKLILCSLSGWGQGGPQSGRAGHDLTYQALAGSLAPTGRMPAAPTADLLGAWSAVSGILATLVGRQRSGRGTHIDAALYDAAGHGNLIAWAAEAGRPHGVGEPHALAGALPCYNLYRSRDGGLVALAALEQKFWRRFCTALGREDLMRLQYDESGAAQRKLAVVMSKRTRAEWAEFFAAHDLPGEPVLAAAEARAHRQAEVRGLLRTAEDRLPRLAFPALFDGERPRAPDHVPALGEHTDRLLEELGMAPDSGSRRELRAGGIGPRRSLRRWLWRLAPSLRG